MSAVVSSPAIHQHRWPASASGELPAGAVYIFHGLSEHGARYEHVARWLAARGYSVGSHDHPAHGRSSGRRGVFDDTNAIDDCAVEQFERFRQEQGGHGPVLLLGHSLGGALATHLVLRGVLRPDALVLSAPAFVPHLTNWQRTQLSLMYRLARNLTVTARLSGPVLTHDESMRQAWAEDPLINRTISARLIKWLVDTGAEALEMAPQLTIPTLLLVPMADVIVRPDASERFAERAANADVTLHAYEGLYHELLNEAPADRQRVFTHLDEWLARVFAG